MGGVDTIAGIGYQQAYTLLLALDVLEDDSAESIRIESRNDVIDIEILGPNDRIIRGVQVKTRRQKYTWSDTDILGVLKRWADAGDSANGAFFEFVTDGRLGPGAKELKAALQLSESGRMEKLIGILGDSPSLALLAVMKRCRIRSLMGEMSEIIDRATLRVSTLLLGVVGARDATERARVGVNDLFKELFVRGGQPDPGARLFRRAELAGILGVDATRRAAAFQWKTTIRERYTSSICSHLWLDPKTQLPLPEDCDPKVMASRRREKLTRVSVDQLLASGEAVVLYGRTGTGKSSATHILRRNLARGGRGVLVLQAEAYVPGRLLTQVASEISRVLECAVPAYTAREVLSDPSAALVFDGVSEIPDGVREALQRELNERVFNKGGAQVVLVGRDVAVLRSVVPVSLAIEDFSMAPIDRQGRLLAATNLLVERGQASHSATVLVAQAESALGDAAGNPMLFTMALSLLAEGKSFKNVAALYEEFITSMARRSHTTRIRLVSLGLGHIFSQLLDVGRRYADPLDWDTLRDDAASVCGLSAENLEDAARRSGLVVPVGDTQILAPVHDSFADYLAAFAHVHGKSTLPATLKRSDSQRVIFIAELAGVDSHLASQTAIALPFTAVKIARFDVRSCDPRTPDEVMRLLSLLRPGTANGVSLGCLPDGRRVASCNASNVSKWLSPNQVPELIANSIAVVLSNGGALRIAVELWRNELRNALRSGAVLTTRPGSVAEAKKMIETYVQEVESHTMSLVEQLFGGVAKTNINDRLGDLGLNVFVSPNFGTEKGWDLWYQSAAISKVTIGVQHGEYWGGTSVEAFLRTPPRAAAMDRLRKAIVELTPHGWM